MELDRMTARTPIARSKSAALSRIVDCVPRGYTLAVQGRIAPEKAAAFVQKMHDRYGIGCTPSQRHTRKQKGIANALLAIYWPEQGNCEWVMLATPGTGMEAEKGLRPLDAKPRLQFLGFELVRHNASSTVSWTWRRPKDQQAEAHALIKDYCNRHRWDALGAYLEMLARQPGFHGVREQTKALCQEAAKKGYSGSLPRLFYMEKGSHGEPMLLRSTTA